jgi:hypothetical protein
MANTLGFGDLEDQQNRNNQQNQAGNAPTMTPGAGQQGSISGAGSNAGAGSQQGGPKAAGAAPIGGGAPSVARPATYGQTNQGTGFQNFQNYAAQNNPTQLQQTVASGLNSQNQGVLNNLGQAQQQFQQGQQQNATDTNQNQQLVLQTLANPTGYANLAAGNNPATAVQAAGQAGGNAPGQQAQQQGSLFTQLMGGQYNGPTALANAPALQAQAQAAQQSAAGLTTNQGRQAVLQQMLGNPNYTSGEQTLDAALLGQAGGGTQALQQAQSGANALQNQIGQATAGANAQGQEQQNIAKQFGQGVQNQFGQTVGNLNSQLQQQAATAQANQTAAYQKLMTDAQGNNLTQQEAQLLGVKPGEEVTNDILQNIQTYINKSQTQATAQNVANQNQYATFDALRQLAGANAPAAAQQALGQYQGQEGQAGSFAAQPVANVNQTSLANQIQTETGAYDKAMSAVQGQESQANEFNRWANNGGGLTAGDYQLAQQYGLDPQLIQAAQQAGGPGQAQESLGQALWNGYLNQVYGGNANNFNANIGGNSRFLNSDWTSGQVQQANQAMANTQKQLNAEYGGESTFNVQNSTEDALQAMANGTVINRNT